MHISERNVIFWPQTVIYRLVESIAAATNIFKWVIHVNVIEPNGCWLLTTIPQHSREAKNGFLCIQFRIAPHLFSSKPKGARPRQTGSSEKAVRAFKNLWFPATLQCVGNRVHKIMKPLRANSSQWSMASAHVAWTAVLSLPNQCTIYYYWHCGRGSVQ